MKGRDIPCAAPAGRPTLCVASRPAALHRPGRANLALAISHCVYVLSVGGMVLDSTPQEVKTKGQMLNAYLGGTS